MTSQVSNFSGEKRRLPIVIEFEIIGLCTKSIKKLNATKDLIGPSMISDPS
jgi:hypothetical protein